MDRDGLLNRDGLWNVRGLALAGAIAGSSVVGWNFYFFEQLLAALALFSLVAVPILGAVFAIIWGQQAAESASEWAKQSVPRSIAGLKAWLAAPLPKPLVPRPEMPVRLLTLGPRFIRELQRINGNAARLPSDRRAA